MRTSFAALLCCLLVASLVGATAVAGAPSTAVRDPQAASPMATVGDGALASATVGSETGARQPSLSVDRIAQSEENQTRPESIEIEIDQTGDAHFVLSKEFPAQSEAQRRAFQRLADEYQRGEHGNLGFATFRAAFQSVSEESDREMELVEDGRHTALENGVGRLEYRFTWTNFATVEEDSVTLGDSFSAGGRVWLELYESQRLVIEAPDGYGVAASPSGPEIEGDSLIWTGPATFAPGDLDVTFTASADQTSSLPVTVLLVLGVLLLIGAIVGLWWVGVRRSEGEANRERPLIERLSAAIPDGTATDGGSSSTAAESPDRTADSADEADEGESATEPKTPAPSESAADAETVDPELLSDGERVEHLLEENGGRMKQANIVSETGWSNAKVSQLLSRMAEEDRVDKLRIGRENLITLPDVDVTDGNGDEG